MGSRGSDGWPADRGTEVTAWLASLPGSTKFLPIGTPEVQYVSSTKIATQTFEIEGADGTLMAVEFKCSGACTGNGCGTSG